MASDNPENGVSDAVLRKRAYNKQWRAGNLEYHAKQSLYQKVQAVKNRDVYLARRRASYARLREKNAAYAKEYRVRNQKHLTEYVKKFKADKKEQAATRPRPDLCEVCNRLPGRYVLCFDHDHVVGHFRGWLCRKCNTVLGLCDDDPKILEALARYLRGHGHE